MDNLIQLTSAPSILIKDFTNQWDWNLINLEIDKQTWTHGDNFKVTDSKNFFSESLRTIKQDILYECTMFINNMCPLPFKYNLDIRSS